MKLNPLLAICIALSASVSHAMTFAIIGDFGGDNAGEKAVANALKEKKPEFIVTVGDNNYPNGCQSTIDKNIGQYYADYIGNYHGHYGKGSDDNRFYPSLGNHDWRAHDLCLQQGTLPYLHYFTLPGNQRYYQFQKDNVHFFILDSDKHEPDGTDMNSKQYQWFKQEVAKSKATFKLAFFHHPPYSSSFHGNNKNMQWDYKAHGIDAVLSGHDHDYERIERNGLVYFVNGLGGPDGKYTKLWPVKGSKKFYNRDYGYMLAEVETHTLTLSFYNTKNKLIDQKIIQK